MKLKVLKLLIVVMSILTLLAAFRVDWLNDVFGNFKFSSLRLLLLHILILAILVYNYVVMIKSSPNN